MAFYIEQDLRRDSIMAVARRMATAARTAPKGKGADNLAIAIVDDSEMRQLAREILRDLKPAARERGDEEAAELWGQRSPEISLSSPMGEDRSSGLSEA